VVWDIAFGIILAVLLLPFIVIGIAIAVQALVGIGRLALILLWVLLALSIPAGVILVIWLFGFCDAGSEALCSAQAAGWLGPFSFLAYPIMIIGMVTLLGAGAAASSWAADLYDKHYHSSLAENDWPTLWLPALILFLVLELLIVFNFEADRVGRELMGVLLVIGAITTLYACLDQYIIWAKGKSWLVRNVVWLVLALLITAVLTFISLVAGAIAAAVVAALVVLSLAHDRGRAERLSTADEASKGDQ
jgi:hypothetical protein